MPTGRSKRQTIQFWDVDVTLWYGNQVLDHSLPLVMLLQATGCTLTIDNQKNRVHGESIYHAAFALGICLVKAIARRIVAVNAAGPKPNAPLCLVGGRLGVAWLVSQDLISSTVKRAVAWLGLALMGFLKDKVGTHSLWAGGAMAMKLNGVDMIMIMKMGRI